MTAGDSTGNLQAGEAGSECCGVLFPRTRIDFCRCAVVAPTRNVQFHRQQFRHLKLDKGRSHLLRINSRKTLSMLLNRNNGATVLSRRATYRIAFTSSAFVNELCCRQRIPLLPLKNRGHLFAAQGAICFKRIR